MLMVESISKSYGRGKVLESVSFTINRSEIAVLLGPNAVGKTTLLNIIAGLIVPDEGVITINGNIVFKRVNGKTYVNIPPEHRGIGYVPQDYALFPHLTVYENIAFGLRHKGLSRHDIDARVKELLELLDLRGKEKLYPRQLSGGLRQKVALARALAPWPKIVLFDEPLSSIDPGMRDRLRTDLRNILKRLKATALIVTHDLNDAWSIADKILVLMNRRIACQGTPADILSNIGSEDVARFFGLNILRGTIVDIDRNKLVVDVNGQDIILWNIHSVDRLETGDFINILFRPDDVVITSCNEESKSLKCTLIDYRITKCNVKLYMKTVNGDRILAEISRGYIYDKLKTMNRDTILCLKIPYAYISKSRQDR